MEFYFNILRLLHTVFHIHVRILKQSFWLRKRHILTVANVLESTIAEFRELLFVWSVIFGAGDWVSGH